MRLMNQLTDCQYVLQACFCYYVCQITRSWTLIVSVCHIQIDGSSHPCIMVRDYYCFIPSQTTAVSKMLSQEWKELCTVTSCICIFLPDANDFPRQALSYIVFVWGSQYFANSFKFAHAANEIQCTNSMSSLTDCCY